MKATPVQAYKLPILLAMLATVPELSVRTKTESLALRTASFDLNVKCPLTTLNLPISELSHTLLHQPYQYCTSPPSVKWMADTSMITQHWRTSTNTTKLQASTAKLIYISHTKTHIRYSRLNVVNWITAGLRC